MYIEGMQEESLLPSKPSRRFVGPLGPIREISSRALSLSPKHFPRHHPVCSCSAYPHSGPGRAEMKLSNQSEVPVYTISGSNTARPLPEWLARRRKRSLKNDPEYANRVELLQDFEFEEASQCIRVSEDGDWVMSTG